MVHSKEALRSRARQLSAPTTGESHRVVNGLRSWLTPASAATVLIYLPMRREIDLTPVMGDFPHHRWMTTRTPESGWLTVHELPTQLERHRFGFLQPTSEAPAVDPVEIDVALLPGVAFDEGGVRLGHGAGYYDELIGRCRSGVELVGVTVERFVFPSVPRLPHDVAVGWVATERGVHAISSS